MAYATENEDPNKKNQDQEENPQPPTTSSAPGAGPSVGGGATAQTPQSAPAQPFQNLQNYLGANQAQVGAQADKTAGELANQYGQTTQAIDQAKTDFGNQVNQGYVAPNPDLVGQAAADPTAFASDPNNVSAFQSLYNDIYSGPNNFESSGAYGDLSGQVNKAQGQADLVGTIPGLQTYYQSQNPNATKGGNVLDAVLMQGSPEAYAKVREAANPFANLDEYLGTATTDLNQNIQTARDTASQTSQGVRNQFTGEGGLIPTLQNELNNRLTQTRSGQSDALERALFDFKGGGATPEELALLGFNMGDIGDQALSKSWESAQNLKNDYGAETNWNALFNPQSAETVYSSPGTVATPEELAKAGALGKLTGQDLSSYLGATSPQGPLAQKSNQGLQDLSLNLNQRDADKLVEKGSWLTGVSDWNGGPAPSYGDFVRMAERVEASNPGIIYRQAKALGDPVLLNVVKRAGFKEGPTAPPDPGDPTGGGIVHAS